MLTHIDDMQDGPIDADAILTDDQLERGGLVKIEAYVRTRTSAAAARKAKQREAQEEAGIKQANITGTADTLETLKAIAKACANGKPLADAIVEAFPNVTSRVLVTPHTPSPAPIAPAIDPEVSRLAEIGRRVEAEDPEDKRHRQACERLGRKVIYLTGWKHKLVHWILNNEKEPS